jgi:hypothetical protein
LGLDLQVLQVQVLLGHQIWLSELLSLVIASAALIRWNALEPIFNMFAASGPGKFLAVLTDNL